MFLAFDSSSRGRRLTILCHSPCAVVHFDRSDMHPPWLENQDVKDVFRSILHSFCLTFSDNFPLHESKSCRFLHKMNMVWTWSVGLNVDTPLNNTSKLYSSSIQFPKTTWNPSFIYQQGLMKGEWSSHRTCALMPKRMIVGVVAIYVL